MLIHRWVACVGFKVFISGNALPQVSTRGLIIYIKYDNMQLLKHCSVAATLQHRLLHYIPYTFHLPVLPSTGIFSTGKICTRYCGPQFSLLVSDWKLVGSNCVICTCTVQ